jgi:choline dehydrogenase-like flavoprotein
MLPRFYYPIKSGKLDAKLIKVVESDQYDFIIVGGGLAGCTLASRLTQGDQSLSILIIEVGVDPKNHPLVTSTPLACFGAHGSDLDWHYKTTPQGHLNNEARFVPAGKALSGGTATNYGTWTRGGAVNYDHWAKLVGDSRWSYQGMLPYLKKTEHHFAPGADPEQHGFNGPIHTATVATGNPARKYPLREPLRAAWKEVGVQQIEDSNTGYQLGLSEMVENWRDGRRQLVQEAYDMSGVHIVCQTLVERVVVEVKNSEKIATGVKVVGGRVIHARKEVILAAGAYRSPQLLLLSGIGPSDVHSRHGIEIVHESPEVGRNFVDHMALCQWWRVRHPEQGLAMGTPLWKDPAYMAGKPCDWVVFSHFEDQKMKDLLATSTSEHVAQILNTSTSHIETLIIYVPSGASSGYELPMDGTVISTCVMGIMHTSRGSITLSSTDPNDQPVIDPNFYATEEDRIMIRSGARQAMKVLQETSVGKETMESEVVPEGFQPLTAASSDEEIDSRVKSFGGSFFHPSGAVSMGKVVDSDLRVYGIKDLRVVDASVLPVSIAGHYQVPIYALAEQAADIILGVEKTNAVKH